MALGAVFVMDKSATAPVEVLTVDVLFAGFGSCVPLGGFAAAVFTMGPLAD